MAATSEIIYDWIEIVGSGVNFGAADALEGFHSKTVGPRRQLSVLDDANREIESRAVNS